MPSDNTTAGQEIDRVVIELLGEMRRVLGDELRAVYLAGSLTAGDFSADRSDLDLVVVTAGALDDAHVSVMREVHCRFDETASLWRTEVEVSYVPSHALRPFSPGLGTFAHLGRGEQLEVREFDRSWNLELHQLREHAIAVVGPPAGEVIAPISEGELRATAATLVQDWLEPLADTPERWRRVGYQAFLVLTACRALHTLETGTIVSKRAAARWVMTSLDSTLHPVIRAALAWRKDDSPDSAFDTDATVALIRLVGDRCRQSGALLGR